MHASNRLSLRRRDLLALGAGAFVVGLVPLALRRRNARLARRTLPVMGTLADIAVVEPDARRGRAALDAAFAELVRVDRTMSRFLGDSDVGRVNRLALREPVAVSGETALVVSESLRWAEATGGAFDPCLGRAVALWDVAHRREPPRAEQVRTLAGLRLYASLELDRHRDAPVILLRDERAAIDLGGIAKGYGVDRAVDALRTHGIKRGLVNVGGDLYALGLSEDGDPWRVGVRDPADPSRLARSFDLTDAAVATSGDYEQYFEHGGERYHHLLDPRTARPRASEAHSVTVTAPTCMAADAAATAAFGADGAAVAPALAARGAHLV